MTDLATLMKKKPEDLNYNRGEIMEKVLTERNMESFEFLLNCKEFRLVGNQPEVDIVDCLKSFAGSFRCCQECSELEPGAGRSRQKCFDFYYAVLCRALSCERLMQSGYFVCEAIWKWSRYTPFILNFLFARVSVSALKQAIEWNRKPCNDAIVIVRNIQSHCSWLVEDKHVPKYAHDDKTYYPFYYIDNSVDDSTPKLAHKYLLAIRLTEVCFFSLAFAQLNSFFFLIQVCLGLTSKAFQLPPYILLQIIECLPGFETCLKEFTHLQRIRRVQSIALFHRQKQEQEDANKKIKV